MSLLKSNAAIYNPKPYIACACMLLNRAVTGLRVLDAAMPKPNAGCIINQGAAVVATPTIIQTKNVGWYNQSSPQINKSKSANEIPMR